MAELLLEILCQEIPSRMQSKACEDLKQSICRGLKDHSLEFTCIEAYVTPRRLTVMVDGMLETQPDIREERRGPRIDAPKRAIDGFLSSNGIQTIEEFNEIRPNLPVIMITKSEEEWLMDEAISQKISQFLIDDIDKNTVTFKSNYDETEHEPVVLPAQYPNLLVNGAGGIAVGMATSIPPHNLGAVSYTHLTLPTNREV